MLPGARKIHDRQYGLSRYDITDNLDEFGKQCLIRSGPKIKPFELYDYQREIAKLIDKYRYITIFKTRQLGLTELLGLRSFHKSLVHPEYAGVFLSIGQKESSNISKRIKILNTGDSLGLPWLIESQTELQTNGGGNVKARPSTINSLRGLESIWDIILDEAAFIKDVDQIYAASLPSQSMMEASGKASTVICSTMSEEGKASWFWRLIDSNNGDINAEEIVNAVKVGQLPPFFWWEDLKGWCKIIVHWKAHPIYGKNPFFLEDIKKNSMMSDAEVEREYNLGIPESGGILFNLNYIELCNYGEWETPVKGAKYIFTIDPNFGGEDFFCLLIWRYDVQPYRLVREFAVQNRSVKEFCIPEVIKQSGLYHPEIIAVESNSGGAIIVEYIAEGCPDVEMMELNTNKANKRKWTDKIAFMFEGLEFLIPPDWEGFKEMGQFSLLDREAIKGHDDRITSWMLFGAAINRGRELLGDAGGMSNIEDEIDDEGLRNKMLRQSEMIYEEFGTEEDFQDFLFG